MPRRSPLSAATSLIARGAVAALATAKRVTGIGLRGRRPNVVRLDDVRRRLELLVTAVYDRSIPITPAEEPKGQAWASWTDPFRPRHLDRKVVLAMTDGERIQLPREIVAADLETGLAEYRLMAIEQAERLQRGTNTLVEAARNSLERDLYLVREAHVIDAAIARAVPGLRNTLATARAQALAARPPLSVLTRAERAVEEVLRGSLSADLGRLAAPQGDETPAVAPEESLEWARQRAHDLSDARGRYRGIAPVAPWGFVRTAARLPHERLERADELATFKGTKYGLGQFGRGSGKGGKQSSETGTEQGTSDTASKGELVLNPDGPRRVMDAGMGDAGARDADGGIDAEADDDTSAPETSPPPAAAATEARASKGRRSRRTPAPKAAGEGIEYPEWDWEAGDYRAKGATVHTREADVSDDSWGDAVLARHGALVRRLRERFERLRARRVRLTQQRDGDELDVSACVRALVDQRSGHAVDDRLYIAVRPARRGIAICLLIDISGSTDEWIDARSRVIDVEKVALLLASEALDALGDLYSVLTFSGKGRANVRMRTVKAFDESNGALVRCRIAALEPEGYTRAGAAIRHAAALLGPQPAAHRLLLIISDGKPNDVDEYEGLRGVEDTRQAILEARAQGVYPFCLTIDRQGQEYLSRIFGESGHTVLRNPSQLPLALVKVVKHLLAS